MSTGKVYLVGAGPGDPGLLTLRGRDLLAAADLVLYDGLVNPLLLELTDAPCERTARTRTGAGRLVPQEEINARLVSEAQQGRVVVRLKGGDPFIFGRGGEEVAALKAAGIPFEVVPGITAATAAGEYAGFSFTHREISSAVAFITGHEDPTRPESRIDYASLAKFPGTLVFYMGLGRVREICNLLIEHGMHDGTPAAVVCKASLPAQRVVTSTLRDLPTKVEQSQLVPPSLIVVGHCVLQRETGSWFEQRSLFSLRIGIARAAGQFRDVAAKVAAESGHPIRMPLIDVTPVTGEQREKAKEQIARLADTDWIVFTSVNGVDAFFELLWEAGGDARTLSDTRVAAIGPATAEAVHKYSVRPELIPETYRAEALAEALAPQVNGKRVLWPRASRGRDVLTTNLQAAGAAVTETVVYRNDDVPAFDAQVVQQIRASELDWIALSSPSIARQFGRLVKENEIDLDTLATRIVSISPVTTGAAHEVGISPDVEATVHTWDGILKAISTAQ